MPRAWLSVRFGNVLGSRGSVLTAFHAQIAAGGPVTVTHPDVTRYFMTIEEAVQLVIQAGAIGSGGDVLVLDMGEPVRIDDVARQMVEQADRPIEIVYTGLREGEKLHEVLLGTDEHPVPGPHPMITHVAAVPLHPAAVEDLDPRRSTSTPCRSPTSSSSPEPPGRPRVPARRALVRRGTGRSGMAEGDDGIEHGAGGRRRWWGALARRRPVRHDGPAPTRRPSTVTTAADSGAGSLRQAILDANAAAGPDTVTVAGPGLSIVLASEIDIDDDVTIVGDATVSGNDADADLLHHLRRRGHRSPGSPSPPARSTATAAPCSPRAPTSPSTASRSPPARQPRGGGWSTSGDVDVEIIDSVLTGNTATPTGGGALILGEGEGQVDEPTLLVRGSTVSGNVAETEGGGGLAVVHVYDITIDATTVSGNTADDNGGGLYQHGHAGVVMTITSSTFSGNTAGYLGGGIDVDGLDDLLVEHTTITGNTVTDGVGGGIDVGNDEYAAVFDHVVIAGNTALDDPEVNGSDADNAILVSFSLIEGVVAPGVISDEGGNIFGEDPLLRPAAGQRRPDGHAPVAHRQPRHRQRRPCVRGAAVGRPARPARVSRARASTWARWRCSPRRRRPPPPRRCRDNRRRNRCRPTPPSPADPSGQLGRARATCRRDAASGCASASSCASSCACACGAS